MRHDAKDETVRVPGADTLSGPKRFHEIRRSASIDDPRRLTGGASVRDDI